MTDSKYYRLLVFLIIMPINGALMTWCWWVGLLLIIYQVPWVMEWAEK